MHKWYRLLSLGVLLLLSVSLAVAQPQELPLGTTLPLQDHAIQHVDGTQTTIGGLTGANGTVFIFWSNNCRWTDSYEDRVLALHTEAAGHDIAFVLVNAIASKRSGRSVVSSVKCRATSSIVTAISSNGVEREQGREGDETLIALSPFPPVSLSPFLKISLPHPET